MKLGARLGPSCLSEGGGLAQQAEMLEKEGCPSL